MFEMGKEALFVGLVLIAGGFLVYWLYGRVRVNREYALLYLVERITAKELTTHSLETELKEIIRERDDIIKDRFDKVIEESIILDIDKTLKIEEFFQLAAETISKRIKLPKEVIIEKFIEREEESTTVISSGLAIPHIIIEGEHLFDVLLVRCKKGIIFSGAVPKVHAIFVLIGTKDERNFHLRALSAIAQIVQDRHFEKKWLAAKNKEVLRDIVLLGKRKR